MIDAHGSSAIEAAALGRLYDYLRKASQRRPVTDAEELVARDAFLAGFSYGTRWAVRSTAALADPQFRQALAVICEAMRESEP